MSAACPVCGLAGVEEETVEGVPDSKTLSCKRCGSFTVSNAVLVDLAAMLKRSREGRCKLSHAIRRVEFNSKQPSLHITPPLLLELLKRDLPRPVEQEELMIRFLGTHQPGPGTPLDLMPSLAWPIIGADSERGMCWILEHLKYAGVIDVENVGRGSHILVTLTFDGWKMFEELSRGGRTYHQAFMAMQFNEELLEKIFKEVFKPSVKQAGFTLRTLNEDQRAGLIDDQLRVRIQSSDFLIADLTHDNSGAYWEAGYAEGLGKPVIYTCEKAKFEEHKTHFDTNHHLTIVWDKDAPEEAGERLKATVRATLPEVAIMVDEECP